mgnify:FL=1
MQNINFHNYKSIEKSLEKRELSYLQNKKTNVDINKLLNRVKIDQQNEKIKEIIFVCSAVLLLSFMGIFVSIT